MKYDKLIIYYFSGTGNAKNASKWILKEARTHGIETELINIDRFEEIKPPELAERTLVGFCFPTHGFNAPPIVIKFLRKFPQVKGVDAFVLNTRAGMKLSKLFLPGLSGVAQLLPALILLVKGFRIVGLQPLDLPSNWLILHPSLRTKVVHSIYNRCYRIVRRFSNTIFEGGRKYKGLISLPIDLAMFPIAIGYYFIGRFYLAKTLVATDACDRCDKCIDGCPVNAIIVVNERPFWRYNCESCMRCVNNCPERAIETTHSFAISMLFIFSLLLSPLLVLLLRTMEIWTWISSSWFAVNVWGVIEWWIFLFFMFLSYGIMHFLMRFKWVNRFIAYTSLSKYSFWRRYRPPRKVKVFHP